MIWKGGTMSELKGQLLGMLMVIVLFASVALTLYGVFGRTTDAINSKMDDEISLVSSH